MLVTQDPFLPSIPEVCSLAYCRSTLDEFAFRHNRRKPKGVVRFAARVIENLVARSACAR
jgi:hypothetical protein